MTDTIRFKGRGGGRTKIRNVPIAVTPEGFWCCPSHALQKPQSNNNSHHEPKLCHPSSSLPPPPPVPHAKPSSSSHKKKHHSPHIDNKKTAQQHPHQPKPITSDDDDGRKANNPSTPSSNPLPPPPPQVSSSARPLGSRPKTLPRKATIELGEPGTSNLKLVLLGKQGCSVKLNVHREILARNSSFFARKLSGEEDDCCSGGTTVTTTPPPRVQLSVEIEACEDVEIYVETIGLMYHCKDIMKARLMKQSVQRVLGILKVAESIGFTSCLQSCLDYLDSVPWVGEDEEDKVVSSVLSLKMEEKGTTTAISVTPLLKRVCPTSSSSVMTSIDTTLSRIVELVLASTEDRSRRQMKSVVLKLLKEIDTTTSNSSSSGSWNNTTSAVAAAAGSDSLPTDLSNEMIFSWCKTCLDNLLSKFKQASTTTATNPDDVVVVVVSSDQLMKGIGLEVDNILWLVDILAAVTPRSSAAASENFVAMWASQEELASLPSKFRQHASCVTVRLLLGIGRGEIVSGKGTRLVLLRTWLEPLMEDYKWLMSCRMGFDKADVEDGIGRTVLTLELEDQRSVLLCWMERFLKNGAGSGSSSSCLDLSRAFEVWWRRVFVRPYGDQLEGMNRRQG